ncbi:MAG TPA: DUF3137 domain-containing protein [Candidatus Binatia bacterium]|nr:DUF3137 domain-containing protein [Candidatus Binatia bacterium]
MNTLRKLFGPSREEIWRQLCTETGADYVQGGFWKGARVQATHDEWTITLDTYAVSTGKTTMVFTRLRAPYVNPDHFRFTIYRRGLFSEIGKWLGMQDVEVGHADFDRDFIIKGTEEKKLRALFDNPRLRELIAAQPQIHLTVKDDEGWGTAFPADTDELCFHVHGIIKDVERLKLLFDLFAETLDELCRIGSAYEEAPKLKL